MLCYCSLARLISRFLATIPFAINEVAEIAVATLFAIKTPRGLYRSMRDGGFNRDVPTYALMLGLVRKIFLASGDSFGGLYLSKDRASADALYNETRRAKAEASFGSAFQPICFGVLVQIDTVSR